MHARGLRALDVDLVHKAALGVAQTGDVVGIDINTKLLGVVVERPLEFSGGSSYGLQLRVSQARGVRPDPNAKRLDVYAEQVQGRHA